MDIIITDVTYMREGHICVAGWSPDEECMVRPLHGAGHPHWQAGMARDDLFSPGNIITVKPTGQPPSRSPPHAAEDCIIAGLPTLNGNISQVQMVEAVSGSVSNSVQNLFGDAFTDHHYIPEGEGFRSLGAMETYSGRMGFDNRYDKLKCWFYDGDNERYSLPISCKALKDAYAHNGIEGLHELKAGTGKAHVRLGLANPWNGGSDNNWNTKRCYAMVNGIFFL